MYCSGHDPKMTEVLRYLNRYVREALVLTKESVTAHQAVPAPRRPACMRLNSHRQPIILMK